MTEKKATASSQVKSTSRDRDTDADGLPDRIDSQYSYPPAEQVKRTRENQRATQSQNDLHKQRRR